MAQLTNLMSEIISGMEIFYSSRMGGRYTKIAFILCDDYVELLSKLWLGEKVKDWNDTKANGSFKSFSKILDEVSSCQKDRCHPDTHLRIVELTEQMKNRRKRRNDFFHSTHLLDLNVNKRGCVDAFCDLVKFGEFLFTDNWRQEVKASPKSEILCVLFQLESLAFVDPTIEPKINEILQTLPRREKERSSIPKKGTQYAKHPEDLHFRLCLDWGGRELLDALKPLLHNRPD